MTLPDLETVEGDRRRTKSKDLSAILLPNSLLPSSVRKPHLLDPPIREGSRVGQKMNQG